MPSIFFGPPLSSTHFMDILSRLVRFLRQIRASDRAVCRDGGSYVVAAFQLLSTKRFRAYVVLLRLCDAGEGDDHPTTDNGTGGTT